MSGEVMLAVATIIAVLTGPILAVLVTRLVDDERAAKARRYEIFRTLMRTRRLPIHFEHVGALNLIEVEFNEKPEVVSAWKAYLANLSTPIPAPEEKEEHDAAVKKRDALLTKLIHEISKVLKFKVEQLDILEGNYIPQGWNDEDWENRLVRRGLVNVLHGKAPLLVQAYQPVGVYPPPPSVEQNG